MCGKILTKNGIGSQDVESRLEDLAAAQVKYSNKIKAATDRIRRDKDKISVLMKRYNSLRKKYEKKRKDNLDKVKVVPLECANELDRLVSEADAFRREIGA